MYLCITDALLYYQIFRRLTGDDGAMSETCDFRKGYSYYLRSGVTRVFELMR
jgi:hypothetical protein